MPIADRTAPAAEEFNSFLAAHSNAGRWGADDALGTLNYITPEVRRAAAALVREGVSFSCSNPLATEPGPRNPRPADHEMTVRAEGSSDYIGVSYHGVTTTHIDALCHIFDEARQVHYNDKPASDVTSEGARSNSIDHWRDGILTRGVLYDVPRFRGTDYVSRGEPVHGWELADVAAAQGIEPRPGDAVLIRSGTEPYWSANPPSEGDAIMRRPGVHLSATEFLHEQQAALLVWDQHDASDQGYARRNPVHLAAIVYLGLPLLDNANLERLADACAERGRYEFMLSVAPLVVRGGTGSPVNPIATF